MNRIMKTLSIHEKIKLDNERCWEKVKNLFLSFTDDDFPENSTFVFDHKGIIIYIPFGVDNFASARRGVGNGWTYLGFFRLPNGSIDKRYYRILDGDRITLSLILDAGKLPENCYTVFVRAEENPVEFWRVECEKEIV